MWCRDGGRGCNRLNLVTRWPWPRPGGRGAATVISRAVYDRSMPPV